MSYYAIRRFTSGKVLGSPRYELQEDAEREASTWREHIGPAAVVEVSVPVAHAVRTEDQETLAALLAEHEPKVWVSTTSHRSRDRLERVTGGQQGPEYGSWKGRPHGSYYHVPARLAEDVARITGVTVLRKPPPELFKRWTAEDTGGPVRGHWPVPA